MTNLFYTAIGRSHTRTHFLGRKHTHSIQRLAETLHLGGFTLRQGLSNQAFKNRCDIATGGISEIWCQYLNPTFNFTHKQRAVQPKKEHFTIANELLGSNRYSVGINSCSVAGEVGILLGSDFLKDKDFDLSAFITSVKQKDQELTLHPTFSKCLIYSLPIFDTLRLSTIELAGLLHIPIFDLDSSNGVEALIDFITLHATKSLKENHIQQTS